MTQAVTYAERSWSRANSGAYRVGGETGANGQASPAPAPCEACELENKTGDEHTNHACRTTPTGAREIDAEARAIAHCYSASTHSFRSVSAHLSRAEAEVESLRKELAEARAWKERMIAVCPPLQEIGRELNVGLGDSIHD